MTQYAYNSLDHEVTASFTQGGCQRGQRQTGVSRKATRKMNRRGQR